MIFAKSVKSFYESHKDEILKLVAKEHFKRTEVQDLTYAFTSSSGAIYYTIPSQMAMPLARLGKNQDLIAWLIQGVSEEDFKTLADAIDKELAHAYAKKDWSPVKLGAIVKESLMRANNVRHYDLLLQLVANNLIRSDEEPSVVNMDIMQEKVDDIERECEIGNVGFFFLVPQLKMLSEIQSMSQEELTMYLAGLKAEAERHKEMLQTLLSWKESEKEEKTSTSS